MYSDPDKTKELEDDMKAIFKCIWCCIKANNMFSNLKINFVSEMFLCTLHNCSHFNSWTVKNLVIVFYSFKVGDHI